MGCRRHAVCRTTPTLQYPPSETVAANRLETGIEIFTIDSILAAMFPGVVDVRNRAFGDHDIPTTQIFFDCGSRMDANGR